MAMTWRLVESLKTLRAQVNKAYPLRNKSSDGSIGDALHLSRGSDHNPELDGTVDALDLTHDPKNGLDCEKLAEVLRSSRDPRIKYVIWRSRIFGDEAYAKRNNVKPWTWHRYTGKNPHTKHIHISVNDKDQDDIRPWAFLPADRIQEDIIATVFGDEMGAYGPLDHTKPLVSLPGHFPRNALPWVKVYGPKGNAIAQVKDFGPSGWANPAGRKFYDDYYWDEGRRPRAESDPTSNGAGIDLNYKLAEMVGIVGKGKVDWEFTKAPKEA